MAVTIISSENIFIAPRKFLNLHSHSQSLLIPLCLLPLVMLNSFAVSADLLKLDFYYKWSHSPWSFVTDFLHLVKLFQEYPCSNVSESFISLSCWECSIAWMWHVVFSIHHLTGTGLPPLWGSFQYRCYKHSSTHFLSQACISFKVLIPQNSINIHDLLLDIFLFSGIPWTKYSGLHLYIFKHIIFLAADGIAVV